MHVTFDPSWDLCASSESCSDMLVALHAIKETILGFYSVKKEYKKNSGYCEIAQSSTKSVLRCSHGYLCAHMARSHVKALSRASR